MKNRDWMIEVSHIDGDHVARDQGIIVGKEGMRGMTSYHMPAEVQLPTIMIPTTLLLNLNN